MRIQAAQKAGGSSNADRVFLAERAVVVLDGASAFEPAARVIEPGTYADTLGRAIANEIDTNPEIELADAVGAAIGHTASALDLDDGPAPSSTVAVLRLAQQSADLYVLGDSPILYSIGTTTHRLADNRLGRLPIPERSRYINALRAGSGYDSGHRSTLAALQRAERRYRNTGDGYWIAEKDPAAAQHGMCLSVPAERIRWAVLATDGAANLLDYLGKPVWAEVAHYDAVALARLLARLHDWEARIDPDGQLLPRAKRHDDKTLVTVPRL